jgi:hypothetical protein
MTFSLQARAKVLAIREHTRTIHGRRDPASGQSVLEHINLGWFIHLDFGFGTPFAIGVGTDRPSLTEGQIVIWRLDSEPTS